MTHQMVPKILRVYDDLIPARLCDEIIAQYKDLLFPATVFDHGSGQRVYSAMRTNRQAFIMATAPLMRSVLCRIQGHTAQPFGKDWGTFENVVQFNHYREGEYFDHHSDLFIEGDKQLEQGQRDITIIVYLNTPLQGGETVFREMQHSIPAVKGRVVLFKNHPRFSIHAGHTVYKGEKYILNTWTRDR